MDSFRFGLNARFLLGTAVGGQQSVQQVENSNGNILMDGVGRNSRILWFSCTILHVYSLDDEAGHPQQSEIEVTYGDTCLGTIILDTSL